MAHIRIKDLRKYMRPATSEELEAEQTYIDSISVKFKEIVYGEWISDEDGNYKNKVWPLPIEDLMGVGRNTKKIFVFFS